MEDFNYKKIWHWRSKIFTIIAATLMGGLCLCMLKFNFVETRKEALIPIREEVKSAYASEQMVYAPVIMHGIAYTEATDTLKKDPKYSDLPPTKLDYKAHVETETVHRSIYDINIFTSTVQVSGIFTVNERIRRIPYATLKLPMDDSRGLTIQPQVTIAGETYDLEPNYGGLCTNFTLPDSVKVGDNIAFSYTLQLKGTEQLMFQPYSKETTLSLTSTHPHPSFHGDFLPDQREVRPDGFSAKWSILQMDFGDCEYTMGAVFLNPVDHYQQVYRSVRYSIIIILLVFIACLLVEFLTRKKFASVQYYVICSSLVLFYALLLSISEHMAFCMAYLIASAMTIVALTCYFRAILRSKVAYLLSMLLVIVYAVNYIMLQMHIYAFLMGTLILFVLLCIVMYFTANSHLAPEKKENAVPDSENADEQSQTTEQE